MTLTYTEIEEQRNTRVWIFFAVVLLFYFLIAAVLGNITKWFFVMQNGISGNLRPFLTPRGLLYVLLFALIAAILHSLYSINNALSLIRQNLRAHNVDLSDKYHERFNNIVDEINVATGSKYRITPMVIPTVAMNAFAISDHRRNAIVGVTEGLLSKLTRQQLQAVVAHEVAHVASGDSFQTTIGCSLFGIYAAMLSGIRRMFEGSSRKRFRGRGSAGVYVFLLIVYVVLSIMQFFYNMIRMLVSRNRELRADAIAVRLTRDPISLSGALYAISRGWRGLGLIDNNLESLFIINPANNAIDEEDGLWANLFSTHPPINRRISILADMAHTDINNIQQEVLSQERLREDLREVPAEKKMQRWMFTDDSGGWQGPFNIPQMMLLGWVMPGTRIKALDSDEIKEAKDEPLFKPFFDKKIEALKTSSLNCPKCSAALVEEEYEGTSVKRCVFCEGVLVEGGKMPRIIIRTQKGFSERVKKMAELAQKEGVKIGYNARGRQDSFLKCPRCGISMLRNFYTMAYLVEVDKCTSCNLIWFDKDELEMVQYLIESRKGG